MGQTPKSYNIPSGREVSGQAYYLAVLNAGKNYVVGVFNERGLAITPNASTTTDSFPQALKFLCKYAQSHPEFTKIHHDSLQFRESDALACLETLLLSFRKK
jgi:hypothetical protein